MDDGFKKMFGVTKAELREKGVDPSQYARQNVRRALRDKKVRQDLLPRSYEVQRHYFQLLNAVYLGLFTGFICLILYASKGLRARQAAIRTRRNRLRRTRDNARSCCRLHACQV